MLDFRLYFGLGTGHILTWEALDHLLFVTALCLRYQVADWKKVVVLVTAFTIGHSVTLALSATGHIHFPTRWIEFLIPLTIVATAFNNLGQKGPQVEHPSRLPLIYFFALFFGLIHGLAYANTFLSLEGPEGLLGHLLAFNLGIEAAQLLVVAIVLMISFIFVQWIKVSRLWWVRIGSVLILVAALKMAWERWPETGHSRTADPAQVPDTDERYSPPIAYERTDCLLLTGAVSPGYSLLITDCSLKYYSKALLTGKSIHELIHAIR